MHYLPFGDRLNKGILMVTQLNQGFPAFFHFYEETAKTKKSQISISKFSVC